MSGLSGFTLQESRDVMSQARRPEGQFRILVRAELSAVLFAFALFRSQVFGPLALRDNCRRDKKPNSPCSKRCSWVLGPR